MARYADELRKMSTLKRNRKNFETVQAEVESLREHAESASEIFDALSELREAMENLENALDNSGDDNPLTENWLAGVREAMDEFARHLPEPGCEDLGEIIQEVSGACDEYESSLEDREYTADTREEIWGQILDGLDSVANAIL